MLTVSGFGAAFSSKLPKNELCPLRRSEITLAAPASGFSSAAGKPSPAAQSGEWLTVKMRYKDPGTEASKLLSQALTGVNSPNQNQLTQLRMGIMHPTTEFVGNALASAAWDLGDQKDPKARARHSQS